MNQIITMEQLVYDVMPQFERIAQSNNMVKWEEEKGFAIQALQKNKKLIECSPTSIQNSVINVAAVGLTLNPADGYAYLVPEYNKDLRGQECQLRISFKGLIKVATDTGTIKWVKSEIVKENDTFQYNGLSECPTHTMNPFSDRGQSIGVYCVAKTNDGEYLCDIMHWEEVLKIKGCAKTTMVWDKWPDEMAKKAMIKRASKQWPKSESSSVLHKAVEVINETEGSDFCEFSDLEETADYILGKIGDGDKLAVGEAWVETTDQEKSYLWKAKTKGGFFTQQEKVYIRESISEYHKSNSVIEGEAEDE